MDFIGITQPKCTLITNKLGILYGPFLYFGADVPHYTYSSKIAPLEDTFFQYDAK